MNMNLLQDFDSVYVENYEPIKMLIIEYRGSFDGEMIARTNHVVKDNHIFFFGIGLDSTNILFNYNGNFRIKKVFAYTMEGKKRWVAVKTTSDDVNRILAEWNVSTSKYTDYNRSNKHKPYRKTILRKRK